MIVKNEQDTLGRCLESVSGVFDEIVIVDTGSADNTKDVAARFAARVLDFGWIDDFAAARNFAFAQATMDYIMWLDADDVLAEQDRAKLLELRTSLDPQIDAVAMPYHTAFDAAGNPTAVTYRFRVVRGSTGFTWVGVVHEDLVCDTPFVCLNSDIVITHRKPADDAGPPTRNLRMFERLIADGRPLRAVDILNYARELELHKRFQEAIPHFQQFLDSGEGSVDARLLALHKLASCYYMTGQPDKEWECTLRSLELDVPRPEFSCRIAERFLSRSQFRQAAFWYDIALQAPSLSTPNAWTIDNPAFRTWLPHKQLGLCYYQLGDYPRSLHHNTAARNYLPEDPDIATNIAVLEDLLRAAPPTTAG